VTTKEAVAAIGSRRCNLPVRLVRLASAAARTRPHPHLFRTASSL